MSLFGRYQPQAVSEMASLSYAAYGSGTLGQQLNDHAPGWRPLRPDELGLDPGRFTDDGYYQRNDAAGYAAIDGDRVAIVFRGSDSFRDLVRTGFAQQDYFDNLQPLIQAAFAYAGAIGARDIVLTGHSLGGAMVQRTAALIDRFAVPEGAQWQMAAFGSPGTDVGITTPFSSTVLNVVHAQDPVPGSPLLPGLTQHGYFASVELPNVAGANTLFELAQQKQAQQSDPAIVTEHDILRYRLSVEAIAQSDLYQWTEAGARTVVLDAADGAPSNDVYAIGGTGALLLGLGGDDRLTGSDQRDLIDGGAGNDLIVAGAGDDIVMGGPGNDTLDGGAGFDVALFAAESIDYALFTSDGWTAAIPRVPEVAPDGTDLLANIESIGFADGPVAPPGENFDALAYTASYPDLIAVFGADSNAAFRHFADHGYHEGRGVTFDGLQYIASYPDLIAAFGANRDAGSLHYITYGAGEGRSPGVFDAARYVNRYPDLRDAFGDDREAATVHYVAMGYDEGRSDDILV